MDNTELLRKLQRVGAPPDFEARVLAELGRRRRALPRVRRARSFQLALQGAAAGFLVLFAVLNIFVFRPAPASLEAGRVPAEAEFLPITEPVDYGLEVRASSAEPRTVYILENVSNASSSRIRY
jgi:hypothetical protein